MQKFPFTLRSVTFQPMTFAYAQAIAGWRYPPPYEVYNLGHQDVPLLMDMNRRYYAAVLQEDLIGLCCFGLEARVPGGLYLPGEPEVLDVGLGLRPDMTGQGLGAPYTARVLLYGQTLHAPHAFRATIAAFNRRSQRVFESLGFRTTRFFVREGGEAGFMQMELKCSAFLKMWKGRDA